MPASPLGPPEADKPLLLPNLPPACRRASARYPEQLRHQATNKTPGPLSPCGFRCSSPWSRQNYGAAAASQWKETRYQAEGSHPGSPNRRLKSPGARGQSIDRAPPRRAAAIRSDSKPPGSPTLVAPTVLQREDCLPCELESSLPSAASPQTNATQAPRDSHAP